MPVNDEPSNAMKLLKIALKATLIAGSTFCILMVPLIIEMRSEAQFKALELEEAILLGTPAVSRP